MSFSTGCRKCMKCGKMYLISLFDDGLCAECEEAEKSEKEPMREFTEEETKAYSKALDKMYKPTGFNVFDEYGNYKYPSDVVLTEPNTATSTPCDDVVSRKWLKKKLQEHHDFFVNAYGGFKNMPQTDKARVDEITNCIAEVVNAPSVRPQEQIGHWIDTKSKDFEFHRVYKCSECGNTEIEYPEVICRHRYCPNCGAKMVEPTCDTCEYNTAAFMPCNACEDKSEYKPQESEG